MDHFLNGHRRSHPDNEAFQPPHKKIHFVPAVQKVTRKRSHDVLTSIEAPPLKRPINEDVFVNEVVPKDTSMASQENAEPICQDLVLYTGPRLHPLFEVARSMFNAESVAAIRTALLSPYPDMNPFPITGSEIVPVKKKKDSDWDMAVDNSESYVLY